MKVDFLLSHVKKITVTVEQVFKVVNWTGLIGSIENSWETEQVHKKIAKRA